MSDQFRGYMFALGAFLSWGLLAIYWKQLVNVPAEQIICHRVVWSLVFTALILGISHRFNEVRTVFGDRKLLLRLAGGSAVLTANWFLFIWAVNNDFVLEASMGYYITPLVNVLLGFAFLAERPRRNQWVAIGLAAFGVVNLVAGYGRFPWVALSIAASFGTYGLIRKLVKVKPIPGLFCETLFATIPAASYLVSQEVAGVGAIGNGSLKTVLLLLGAGMITSMPLLWFASAARYLPLTTIGLIQYITPTCFFLLGVFVYHEHFTTSHLITFGLIWCGILLYTTDTLRNHGRRLR